MRFAAIAFDLDGTLYPAYRLNMRLVPLLLKDQRLLRAQGEARARLRKSDKDPGRSTGIAAGTDFYEIQASIMGEILNESAEAVRKRTELQIYRGWEPIFRKIKLFPHVRETLDAFCKQGIKMGLLSDFPPEKKLENLGLAGYWDVVVCSELTGHLKPDSAPFLELARQMGKPPQEILYVGNSVSYDAEGAKKAGMKAALIRPRWKKRLPASAADFVFYDYRQLRDYVLN